MAEDSEDRIRCWASGARLSRLLHLNLTNRLEDQIYDFEEHPSSFDPEASRKQDQREVLLVADAIDKAVAEAWKCDAGRGAGAEFLRDWSEFHDRLRRPPEDLRDAKARLNELAGVTTLLQNRIGSVGPPE